MNNSKKLESFGIRSAVHGLSNLALAVASPRHARSISREIVNNPPNYHLDSLDLSLDLSIAGFKKLKEAAEAIPVAGGPLKASCGIIISILQLVKLCKENREGWERLSDIMREKTETILALLKLYSNSPVEYPSVERHAREYQRVLSKIALDIKIETQKQSEALQGLEAYWSKIRSTGREALLADINAERIASYYEELRMITFDVIEKTVISQATVVNDIKAILMEKSSENAPTAILRPPPRRVRDFVGRKDMLELMCRTHLSNHNSLSHYEGPTITVLTGMGGSGKTQIAVMFASLFEDKFPGVPVFFLNASSEASLTADLVTLVRSQTDNYDDALTWLANGIKNWLLIMDNADDPSLKLSTFLPRTSHGHVIITTRNATHKLLAPRSFHAVDGLPMEDSITLLLRSSESEDSEANHLVAKEITDELGRLPLALAHAAAYILINNCLDTFLATYRTSRNRFLQSTPDLPHDYPHSVERTIEMSFRSLSTTVQGMMTLFARFLSPHIRLVRSEDVVEAGDLCGFGKILSEEGDGLGITHLEQCVEIWKCSLGEDAQITLEAMVILAKCYKLLGRLQEALPLQEDILQKRRKLLGPDHLDTVVDMSNLANTYESLERVQEALPLHEEVLQKMKHLHGPDDLETLMAVNNVAICYYGLGRMQEALPLQEGVLQKWKKLLGPGHLSTLVAMRNLANIYASIGRVGDALLLEKEVFEERKKLLGPDHRGTLGAMLNLLLTLEQLAMEEELKTLAKIALPLYEKVYGAGHEDTLWISSLIK
ncbi:hypothetical protein FRC18_011809 [Serendipita sp. 400]|nr:hypothetical protein FRC18_011809 [Serendipita sp. 400]